MTLVATAPTDRITSSVMSTPSPGNLRPRSRAVTGAVKPSMIPKIHTNAATLITSGTVTKKPARNVRRSHAITASRSLPLQE